MKKIHILSLIVTLLVFPITASADPPLSATMRFGIDTIGGGEANRQARHSVVPGTVVISAGGTVNFDILDGFHQIFIYEPGKRPRDVNCADATNRINDLDLLFDSGQAVPPSPDRTESFTFDEPGRYLIICNVTGHFCRDDMYGWVIVQ